MRIVMIPAISAVAAATIAIVGPTFSGVAGSPEMSMPVASGTVPMIRGLSAMM